MAGKYSLREKLRSNCRFEQVCRFEDQAEFDKDLFSREWEVFVIKRDAASGQLVVKLACCALEPV